MIASVHTLRMLGVAHSNVDEITEKPFGHPARDAGVKAEALGVFAEWGLGAWSEPEIEKMALRVGELVYTRGESTSHADDTGDSVATAKP